MLVAPAGTYDVVIDRPGTPVRIHDVAKNLIKRSGRNIEIVFTGLRPNEKMDEVLFSVDEAATTTAHEMISRVSVPPLSPAALREVDGSDPESLAALTAQGSASRGERQRPSLVAVSRGAGATSPARLEEGA